VNWIGSKLLEFAVQILGVAIFGAVMMCFFRGFHQIIKRGYYWFAASIACVLSVATGVGIVAGLYFAAGAELSTRGDAFLFLSLGVSGGMACLVPQLFPVKSRRRAGPRRTMWKRTQRFAYAFAGLCGALAALIECWHVWRPGDVEDAGLIILNLLVWGALGPICAWGIGRRAKLGREVDQDANRDTRPPVLYLREFGDERRPFIVELTSQEQPNIRVWRFWINAVRDACFPSRMNRYREISFERYMTEAIETGIGPLVALGSPEDYLTPEGAARVYAADDEWRESFPQIANSAQAIILSPGCSGSLRWELDYLLRSRLAMKLFVALGPNAFELPLGRRIAALQWAERFAGFAEWKPVDWPRFQRTMREVGYGVPLQRPLAPAVIAFNSRAEAVMLTVTFDSPHGYVAAIKGYLNRQSLEWRSFIDDLFDHLKRSGWQEK
jgi:hypothetical protein